jgi:hypothetical protein
VSSSDTPDDTFDENKKNDENDKNMASPSGDSAHDTSDSSGSSDSSGASHNDDELSDQEVAKALEGFEDEFKDFEEKNDFSGLDDLKDLDPFESELEGILGDKAKAAMLITPLQQADLLSAFCVLADVSAYCIGSEKGAVAILKNLEGSSPESAAKDLTTVVSGLSVVLAINRADKLEAKLWIDGKAGSDFAPPILFMQVADFVEDFMIGSANLDSLKANGFTVTDSGEMSRGEALKIIASHTRFHPGQQGTGIVE